MDRRQLLQQMVCLGLVVLLLPGCGRTAAPPTALSPTPPAATAVPPTATAIPAAPLAFATALPTPTPIAPESLVRLDGKRALFIIYQRFQQTEYGMTRAVLEDLGVVATVASLSAVVSGSKDMEVLPDAMLADVHGGDYDVIILVGGSRYETDDPEAQRIVRQASAAGNLVAAICIAPVTLAKADIVNGKRVTGAANGKAELKAAGAVYVSTSVVRDGTIITAKGPGDTRRFAEAIAAALGE